MVPFFFLFFFFFTFKTFSTRTLEGMLSHCFLIEKIQTPCTDERVKNQNFETLCTEADFAHV